MMYEQRFNPLSQLALLLALFGAGFVITGLVGLVVGNALHLSDNKDLLNELMKPENAKWNRLIQVFGSFFTMAVPAFIVASLNRGNAVSKLGFKETMSGRQILLVVFIMIAGTLISGSLGELNQMIPLPQSLELYFRKLEDNYNKEVLAISNMKSTYDYIMSLIILAALPAIFEEMLFRGCLQKIMLSLFRSAFIAIFVTSFIFSAIHFSYFGFLPRLFLGLMLGYIFYYSKNLWLSITAHFLNNAYAVTGMYIYSRSGKLNADALEDTFPLYYGVIGAVIFIYALIEFKKESVRVVARSPLAEEKL
jgi:membrane protease YdiL (CAAX protease family)